MGIFFLLAMVCMVGAVGSLMWGLFAMAKGTEKDHRTSNKMMRWRVTLQAMTVVFLLLAFLTMKS